MPTLRRRNRAPISFDELKWGVRQRLAMIEAAVLWEERVTTGVLMSLFGISRGQASKDFTLYQTLARRNLVYDLNLKAYVAAKPFAPRFIRGTAEEYLQLVTARAMLGDSSALAIAPPEEGIEVLRAPDRRVDLPVLRVVHRAIRERRQMHARYQSMNRAARPRRLEPHTLVFDGFRWHTRAYCYERQSFRDFVLARFLRPPELAGPAAHTREQDEEWNRSVTLRLLPNPKLSREQQEAVALDYGMHGGHLDVTVRSALSLYQARLLRVKTDAWPGAPKEERVVLEARILVAGRIQARQRGLGDRQS